MDSLLLRPQLPAGWTITAVAGDGNPDFQFGDIVPVGTLPAGAVEIRYTVQVPIGQTGSVGLKTEVEMQFRGDANPTAAFSDPDPLALSNSVAVGVPVITQPPLSSSFVSGADPMLSVAASGSGLSYQWRFNGVDIPGATGASFSLNNATRLNAGDYAVVVSNSSGSVTNQTPAVLRFFGDLGLYSGVWLGGSVGDIFRIDQAEVLGGSTNWNSVTNVQLNTSPQLWVDPDSVGQPLRFYRSVLQ